MTSRCSALTRMTAGAGCLLLAGALLLVPALGASAAEPPGSGLGSYNLAANAPAVQIRQDDGNRCGGEPSSTGGCEGVIPETVSTLRNGPVGYALSAVVWPGTLAGNLGTLLIVAGEGQVPQEATILNSPVRAEARTGDEPQTNTDYPGAKMTASADPAEVTATAEVAQSAALPIGTFGNSASRSRTALTGVASAVSEAASSVQDVSLAGGVVKIGSVRSTATATTDGVTAKVEGRTTVTGMTIANVPVVVDQDGVRVADQSNPLNKTLSEAVNTAIKNAGMTIAISQPTTTGEGANLTYSAGSLVFFWQQSETASMSAVFGGASVTVAASPGLDFDLGDIAVPSFPVSEGFAAPPPADSSFDLGSAPSVSGELPVDAPVAESPATEAVAEPALARRSFELFDGLSPAVVALGLVGVGLFAAGLKRLPDRVLEGGAAACVLGEEIP